MGNTLLGNWLKFLENILAIFPKNLQSVNDSDWTMSLKNSAKEHSSK